MDKTRLGWYDESVDKEGNMKKKIMVTIMILALCLTVFAACYGDKDYLKYVEKYGFWSNTAETSIAQPQTGNIVRDFLSTPSVDGKTKKVAFIGYDGCRADALINALKTSSATASYEEDSPLSGLAELLKGQGSGIYLAYAGETKARRPNRRPARLPVGRLCSAVSGASSTV